MRKRLEQMTEEENRVCARLMGEAGHFWWNSSEEDREMVRSLNPDQIFCIGYASARHVDLNREAEMKSRPFTDEEKKALADVLDTFAKLLPDMSVETQLRVLSEYHRRKSLETEGIAR